MGEDSDIELPKLGLGLGIIAVTVVVFISIFTTFYLGIGTVIKSNTGATQRQNASVMQR